MKRIAIVLVAALATLVLAAPTASADVTVDLYSGIGTVDKADVIEAFGWTGKQFDNRAADVRFRRDGVQSWTITCLPTDPNPDTAVNEAAYGEVWNQYFVVYADPTLITKGKNANSKVTGFNMAYNPANGHAWTPPQVATPEYGVTAVTHCQNGDPASRPNNQQPYWTLPNVMVQFHYQLLTYVAEWNGTSSAVLATTGG